MKRVKVMLVALAMTAAAAAQGWTVVPGKSVGPIALNMSPAQIGAQLQATENLVGSDKNPMYVRYGEDVLVQYAANRAVMITLNKATIKTKAGPIKWTPFSGAGIGANWSAVEPTLGRNYVSRDLKVAKSQAREVYYAYSSKGLGFRTKAGVIVQVDVWAAK